MQQIKTDWKDVGFAFVNHNVAFKQLNTLVTNAYKHAKVCPPAAYLFRALTYFDVCQTKVVLLGQDPYSTPGVANGLAFGTDQSKIMPPSLRNLLGELQTDLNVKQTDYSLVSWAKQGVLLLNTSLTVNANAPGSHLDWGWKPFVLALLKTLITKQPRVVFLCLGKHAQKLATQLNAPHVVSVAHPSPLSAHAFFGSRPFRQINAVCAKVGVIPPRW